MTESTGHETKTEKAESAACSAEPRITAFVCKWCTYAGADLAGTSRMTYPAPVRTLMLPCTGRIDVTFIIRAFLQGADGVLVSGCHPGDCHYTAGNFRARRRWILFRDLLDTLGVDLRRLEMAWISAAEGAKWVKTIEAFSATIKTLGPYQEMRHLAQNRLPEMAPSAEALDLATTASPGQARPVDPALATAVAQALDRGTVRAVVGWTKSPTLGKLRPAWITSSDAVTDLAMPSDAGNLVRLLRHPHLKPLRPWGLIARNCELLALNVLIQEAQLDPQDVVLFAVSPDGTFLSESDLATAADAPRESVNATSAEHPAGFDPQVLARLDQIMAWPREQRWTFWVAQAARCLRCYACRQACPACTCEQCFAEKNQPQWFPTAADGPGNFAWQLLRGFHLAGRCVGCGACQAACPARIPLNLIGAAVARAALDHFGHRAGVDANGVPLQSDYKPNDRESFIL